MKSVYSPEYATLLRMLVDARNNLGLTQLQLAKRINKRQTFVSKYERGERRLDIVELVQISRCLQIDPHGIIDEIEKSDSLKGEAS